jgi:hypothetical protein
MRHKIKIQRQRVRKLFWLFAAAAVSALLLEEQAAVLYVLATFAACGVLLVVAISKFQSRAAETKTGAVRADDVSTSSMDLSRGVRIAA